MPQFKDEHVLLIAPGSQTTLAQLGLPESFTPASHRFPTRMFPAGKKGEFEPFKIREKRRELNTSTTATNNNNNNNNHNGDEKPDVDMTEAPKHEEGTEAANGTTETKTEEASHANGETAPTAAGNGTAENHGQDQEAEPKEEIFLEEDIISDEGAVYPIRNGHIVDWPCFLSLLEHVYNTLSPPFHTPILILSEPAWTARDREILTQFIFEKFKPPAFCLMDSALAACYAYGTINATVVDIGHGKANVTAVLDSVVQENGRGIALEDCGGETMTDRLEELLKSKGFTREMCEQLKRSNITEILPPGTPLPGSTATKGGQGTTNPAAAASTGPSEGNNASKIPRGPGRGTQTENNENGDDDEGVLDVAAIVTSGNTNEFLAKREKEKASTSNKKSGAEQAKQIRLPNSKRETASFQFEEFARINDSVQYMRQRRDVEVGTERFLLTSSGKERTERGSNGVLEDLAAQIHHTILAVPDAAKRGDLWDNLIIIGNGSRIRGFVPALLSTITQKYILSPSAGIFTSEIPSNISTPMATGGTTTPAHPGSQTPGPLLHPAAHGVNPLLVAATHANAPPVPPTTPGMHDNPALYMSAMQHRSTGHSQTPSSVKTVKPPDYFPEWKDQGGGGGGSNAPGATGAGGTNTTSSNPAGAPRPGMEESVFLGAQIAAKMVFINDNQGQYKGYLPRAEYNENGPSAIHEYALI